MNDENKDKNTFNDKNLSSNGDGNKGITSSGSGGGGGGCDGGKITDSRSNLSSMGPNYNNNNYQFNSPNSQQNHGHHQHDTSTKIGTSSSFNYSNDHLNDGANRNQLDSVNGNPLTNHLSSEVCRDFLRNVCRRGANCRYRHPEGIEAEELGKKVDLIFCHDYQNKECRRSNCRFIHCTKQEEEIYRVTGKLPANLIDKSYSRLTVSSSSPSSGSFHHHQHHNNSHLPLHQQSLHHQQQTDFIKSFVCDNTTTTNNGLTNGPSISSSLASSFVSSLSSSVASSSSVAYSSSNPIPVCKDNLKGDCLRGLRCKFRHVSQSDYDLESRSSAFHSSTGVRPSPIDRNQYHHGPPPGNLMDGPSAYQGGLTPPEPKRRAYDASHSFSSQPPLNHTLPPPPQRITSSFNHQGLSKIQLSSSNDFEFSKPQPQPPPLPPSSSQIAFNSRLEDENYNLRRHVEELKKQVADLMASNEFLMEQNAQLRTLSNRSTTPLPPPHHPGSSVPQLSHSSELLTGSRSNDHLYPHQLSVALATTLNAQTTGSIPVSSMAALSTNVINNSTNPLISYPLMATTIQSLRPPTIPHSLSH